MPVVCDRCGSELSDASRFCPQCGRLRQFKARPMMQRSWWRVLIVGLILYWATAKLLASTGNPNMIPTVILLGAFLIPVTYVVYLYESGALYDVPIPTVALTFFYGGVLGVIAATLLEEQLVVGMSLISVLMIGLSEEIAKPLGVLWLVRKQEYADELHGLVLGGAAGMGFAALETMGYGFTFLIMSGGNLNVLGQVLVTRGLLSPLAHGTWTAIVVGSIYRERVKGRFWLNGRSIRGFLTAVILHALWDLTAGLPITISLPNGDLQWSVINLMIPEIDLPIPGLIVGAIGIWILMRMFRESVQRPMVAAAKA